MHKLTLTNKIALDIWPFQLVPIAVIEVISGFDIQTRLMGHFPMY